MTALEQNELPASVGVVDIGAPVRRPTRYRWAICALCVTPLMLGWLVDSMWLAIALVSLAAAAHQGWSANIFTMASDMFPRRAVASVVGIGGMFGSVGGMLFAAAAGLWLEASGSNYVPLFFVCGLAYVFALGVIHRLVPRLEPAPVDR